MGNWRGGVVNSKDFLTRNIKPVFKDDGTGKIFPDGYINEVKYWGNVPSEKLHKLLPDGTPKLYMMDVDIGDKCSLACPHCFRRDRRVDTIDHNALTADEIIGYIKQAKDLGLENIKILGRGEPFENEEFLPFLRTVTQMDVGVSIFTKGHVLGSDELARKYNPDIKNAKELVAELAKLKVSFLIGFNTFDDKKQLQMLGIDKIPESHPLKNMIEIRNTAIMNLVNAGFNKYEKGEATRLCFMIAPYAPDTIDDVFEMYKWTRVRNIHIVACPTMISGKGIDAYKKELEEQDYHEYIRRIQKVYADVYKWAIKSNLIPLETFMCEGVSMYAGAHVCQQTAIGMYLNLSGQVVQCPGRVDKQAIFTKDIRKTTLKDVWVNSANGKRAKFGTSINQHCAARDGYSIPADFYSTIEAEVLKKFKK